jgi:SAM-dependent methyltransferase
VIAVDPSEPMLAALRRRSPRVDIRVGTAHAIPVETASVDVLCVGDAIHWFGDRAAFTEIARVLQPGGRLAVLHHRAAWEVPWAKRLGELLEPLRRQAGAFPHERWEEAMAAVFGTVTRAEIPHTQHVDPDDFVALISSWSWVANVAQAVREPVLADVRRLVGDEVLELPYVTDVAIASRAR